MYYSFSFKYSIFVCDFFAKGTQEFYLHKQYRACHFRTVFKPEKRRYPPHSIRLRIQRYVVNRAHPSLKGRSNNNMTTVYL